MNPDPPDNCDPGPVPIPSDPGTHDEHAQADPRESAAPPPPVPRPLMFKARIRALTEPRSRFWFLTGIILLLIAAGFLLNTLYDRNHEAWLIAHGRSLIAVVHMANDEFVPDRPQNKDSRITLIFSWNGQDIETKESKLPGRKEPIFSGSKLPIHVNPQNPDDWTWLNTPLPLMERGIAAMITVTLPLAMLALVWAFWIQLRMLRTWRHGAAVEMLIVNTRSTAVAPRCRAVDVTPADENDKRIYTVFLPPNLADMEQGEMVYILRRSEKSRSAVAAAWFE